MDAKAFRATLTALGISQRRLGRLLNTDKATPNRWANGESAIPMAVELLLKLIEAGETTIKRLEELR